MSTFGFWYRHKLQKKLAKRPFNMGMMRRETFIRALEKKTKEYIKDSLKNMVEIEKPKAKKQVNGFPCKNEFCPYNEIKKCGSPNDESNCKNKR